MQVGFFCGFLLPALAGDVTVYHRKNVEITANRKQLSKVYSEALIEEVTLYQYHLSPTLSFINLICKFKPLKRLCFNQTFKRINSCTVRISLNKLGNKNNLHLRGHMHNFEFSIFCAISQILT